MGQRFFMPPEGGEITMDKNQKKCSDDSRQHISRLMVDEVDDFFMQRV
jgi:hypothetical protein